MSRSIPGLVAIFASFIACTLLLLAFMVRKSSSLCFLKTQNVFESVVSELVDFCSQGARKWNRNRGNESLYWCMG